MERTTLEIELQTKLHLAGGLSRTNDPEVSSSEVDTRNIEVGMIGGIEQLVPKLQPCRLTRLEIPE
jgi:hypothetical protein